MAPCTPTTRQPLSHISGVWGALDESCSTIYPSRESCYCHRTSLHTRAHTQTRVCVCTNDTRCGAVGRIYRILLIL
jgi:hypothetical protein